MIYAITDNPYKEGVTGYSNGVAASSKAAKLNNDAKRPALVKNWENLRPVETKEVKEEVPAKENYDEFLGKVNISVVEHAKNNGRTEGAKKIRVNKIVNEKAAQVYNSVERIAVEVPKVEEKPPIPEPTVEVNNEFVGKHGKTGEIPVNEVQEAVKNDELPPMSRVSRNMSNEVVNAPSRVEPGDVDLYNSLLHNEDDISKQLQGARNQLSIERAENEKLIQEYEDAVKQLQELKTNLANRKKEQEEKARTELTKTLNDIEAYQRDNLEKTSDISSVKAEIAKILAEERELNGDYSARGMGR